MFYGEKIDDRCVNGESSCGYTGLFEMSYAKQQSLMLKITLAIRECCVVIWNRAEWANVIDLFMDVLVEVGTRLIARTIQCHLIEIDRCGM